MRNRTSAPLWLEPGPRNCEPRPSGKRLLPRPRSRPHRVLDLLNHVSAVLDQSIEPEAAAWSVLVALTAGEGLAFNRAFLLLAEDEQWRGFFGVGPRSREEARELWANLRRMDLRPLDSIAHPDPLFVHAERERHHALLERLTFPIARGCGVWRRAFIARTNNQRECVRHWMAVLDSQNLAVIPLFAEEQPWGVVLADNFVTHSPIYTGALDAAETMARYLRGALERTRLMRGLEEEKRRRVEAEHTTALLETARALAHDLKNPLALAGGLASELSSSPPGDADTFSRQLGLIAAAVQRAEERVSELTNGLATRAQTVEIGAVEVGALADHVVTVFRPLATSRNVRLVCYHPARPLLASAARQPIERCLENLIGNALQAFGPLPGEIQIAAHEEEPWVRLEVADNGPALPPALRADPFAGGLSTRHGGSGVGLASVRSAIEAMGGRVEYDEREPGWVRFTLFMRRWV